MQQRYEVRMSGSTKFQVYDQVAKGTQEGGLSKSAADKLCGRLNKVNGEVPRTGPVRATIKRLDQHKAIGQ